MAISAVTPRDKLQRLVDLGRKTLRYWWLVAVFAVVGGALSLVFAITRPRQYQSEAVLSYGEQIKTNVLTNRQQEVDRNIGEHYRELALARVQLAKIVADPKLNQFKNEKDPELAVDKLRSAIKFTASGGNTFHIVYTDFDPDRAQAVTAQLTKLLQEKDEEVQNSSAQATVGFAMQRKAAADDQLRKNQQAFAGFLVAHPEFAQDNNSPTGAEGAAVRARQRPASSNPRLDALERQRNRIQARLDAPPDAPPVRIPTPPSAEKIAADAAVGDAQRELNAANRELEDALSKYTDKHPTVINAQQKVAAAQAKLRHAQASVPPDTETAIAPATPADRTKLQKQLAELDGQIADEQKRVGKGESAALDASAKRLVDLESEYARLKREVDEGRESSDSASESARRAQMDADQKMKEQGRLGIIDPANRPVRPSGPGKTIFLLAGMILFLSLGIAFAVGLAVIDDRLYRRADIDQLGIAVLAVIPPPEKAHKPGARSHKEAA
jgi:uncharacterized protein involved in exopolysaccharide biosynthesis